MGKNQWVSPRDGGKWGVHGEGNQRDTKLFDTQKAAWGYAIDIAKNQKREVIVQGLDGKSAPRTATETTLTHPMTPSINRTWVSV